MISKRETINAQIESTFLGIEDHGILTAILHCSGDGWGQGFGMYGFGSASKPITLPFGIEFIRRVLDVVGVGSWEELPGKHIRLDRTFEKIVRIGHITRDKWFDPAELALAERSTAPAA